MKIVHFKEAKTTKNGVKITECNSYYTKSDLFLVEDKKHYPIKKGTLLYKYILEGSEEELKEFERKRGEFFCTIEYGEHKGKPFVISPFLPEQDETEMFIESNWRIETKNYTIPYVLVNRKDGELHFVAF